MDTGRKIKLAALAIAGVFTLAAFKPSATAVTAQPDQVQLAYLADGSAALPANYRDWPFLSSGVNMNYSDVATPPEQVNFDNVFVDPGSLRTFRMTGKWREGAVFVKEERLGSTKGSINKTGQFQTEKVSLVELHVKDAAKFKGGWAFFIGGSNGPAKLLPPTAGCYACHQAHAAVDTTFVQFYPTLIGIAREKATFSAVNQQEIANGQLPPPH